MNRKPLGCRPIDPKRSNVFLDSCAFDPKYSPEDQASQEIRRKYLMGELKVLNISHSNQKEVDHPNTPVWVKNEAKTFIFSIQTGLTDKEYKEKQKILRILTGNGKQENFVDDAYHVFEASKYGGYFITTDKRILNKRNKLKRIHSAIIVKPSEFLEILSSYENI